MNPKLICELTSVDIPLLFSSERHLPANLAGRLEESLSDRDLLDLGEEIALPDVKISDVLSNLAQQSGADEQISNCVESLVDLRSRLVQRHRKCA